MAIDKAQKQLIDTYFRKRKIAVGTSRRYEYKDYEFSYFYKIGLIKIEELINFEEYVGSRWKEFLDDKG